MPPFICYTDTKKVAGDERRNIVYVNVAFIAQATFSEQNKTLQLLTNVPVGGRDFTAVTLEGDEAKEALEVLKSMK